MYKKSGTALLLFRLTGSGIAIGSEQATPKSTPICTNTYTPNYSVYGYRYTYPENIKCRIVLEPKEFTRFVKPKHSAIDAFIMSVIAHP